MAAGELTSASCASCAGSAGSAGGAISLSLDRTSSAGATSLSIDLIMPFTVDTSTDRLSCVLLTGGVSISSFSFRRALVATFNSVAVSGVSVIAAAATVQMDTGSVFLRSRGFGLSRGVLSNKNNLFLVLVPSFGVCSNIMSVGLTGIIGVLFPIRMLACLTRTTVRAFSPRFGDTGLRRCIIVCDDGGGPNISICC